jgi:pSer/pThr/pTyr-binding forkhead associated (FHA) protein
MAKLVVLSAGLAGKSFELKPDRTTLGRLDDNDFALAEGSVSSHHAEIFSRGSDWVVKDLNSTNGTFINGEPTKEAVLKPGQTLRLGQMELKLEDPNAPAPPPPPPAKEKHAAPPPAGVKLNELEQGPKTQGNTATFAKKNNKVNKLFMIGGIVMGVLILGAIVYAILSADSISK